MAPALTMDMTDDFAMPDRPTGTAVTKRSLLISPPSLSSHQEKLNNILEMHDRSQTDFQMLDRLSLGLVSLPDSTYDLVMILSDADGTRRESGNLINRNTLALLVQAMKPGALLRSQDEQYGAQEGTERNEAILAGLSFEAGTGFVKPDFGAQDSVPLRLGGKKKVAQAAGGVMQANGDSVSVPLNTKRKSQDISNGVPAGVGFDDGVNTAPEDDSDDELIDEDTILDENDLKRPINVPTECKPKAKRRRACKDCTCGLAQKLEAEDKAKRANADQALSTMKLQADELAEVDFTVQGKVGSCGNCSLGGKPP